ncbi:hypothetical protein ACPXCS_30735, partial [Streptomyces sp. DT190]
MSWTRGPVAVLAACVLSLAGTAGCGSGDAPGGEASPSPVGSLLEDRDKDGRPYREVGREGAPDVGVEVQPDAGGGWNVRLTVRGFRFSPPGSPARAVAGRGLAHLYVDGRLVARLRTPEYRLPARLVPPGTHQVTARLYADDGSVWAVDGEPVETTADVTASRPGPDASPAAADRRWARARAVDPRWAGGAGRAEAAPRAARLPSATAKPADARRSAGRGEGAGVAGVQRLAGVGGDLARAPQRAGEGAGVAGVQPQ